jgi:hypothetical protein
MDVERVVMEYGDGGDGSNGGDGGNGNIDTPSLFG